MTAAPFRVERIDHVKVCVPDREEAARWYHEVFGLRILHGPAWDAAAIPDGPLFLGTNDAVDGVKVVLFQGEPQDTHPAIGLTRAAFSVAGEPFLRFLDHLSDLHLFNEDGQRVTRVRGEFARLDAGPIPLRTQPDRHATPGVCYGVWYNGRRNM